MKNKENSSGITARGVSLSENLEREENLIMENEKTKDIWIGDYVHAFEKSLNYLAGVLLAILVAGIAHIASTPDISLLEIVRNVHDNPRDLLCILTAVLSTLPYYVYYTLKENKGWNAYNGKKDHVALAKIGIMYEICIMNCFYLLYQGDPHYAGSKLVISVVNITLVGLYIYLLFRRRKAGDRVGYFIIVIGLAILFFLGLSANSLYNLIKYANVQKYPAALVIMLFFVNSGINLFFLTKFDSTKEMGIIANRLKIMVPVISISTFTISVTYCFFHFPKEWEHMLLAALWITGYEIFISRIRSQNSSKKISLCVSYFLIFMFGLPVIIWGYAPLPNELALKWFTLIGISIYCAAVKYWGYILKFLFGPKVREEPKDKLMNVLTWFRNSMLGSMLLISGVLLPDQRLYILLGVLLICSLLSELYLSQTVFKNTTEAKTKIYKRGRIIEFLVIIFPVIIFGVECLSGGELSEAAKINVELPGYSELFIAVLGIVLVFGYIVGKWKGETTAAFPGFGSKELLGELLRTVSHLRNSSNEALPDKNAGSFWTVLISWGTYVILAGAYLRFVPAISDYRMEGMIVMISIVVLDWCSLSMYLINYYIGKMKEGLFIVKFQKIFERVWGECLHTLDEFKQKDAEQFKVGDRLRPILFFLGSSLGRYEELSDKDYEVIAKTACSLELIHKASVIFDDYIDGDTMRKGVQTFHAQYEDVNVLILLGNTMLAKAQINFADCKDDFKCRETITIRNMQRLAELVVDLCTGCYRELTRADYDKQTLSEIKGIICMETVSLIKGSLELGYSCFHEDQGSRDRELLEKLGESLGYAFQYLNDLEPFSQRALYEEHKGVKSNFDYGKKNIAMLILYQSLLPEEKQDFNGHSYENILRLYHKYNVEQQILEEVKKEISKIEQIMNELKAGNTAWINAFEALFNLVLKKKGWEDKLPHL